VRRIEEIRSKLAELGSAAVDEVMTLAPGGAHTAADLEASREPNSELLARGVRIRTVYLESVRNNQDTLDHVHWLGQQGAHVRTSASLPIRLILIDHRVAVLPVNTMPPWVRSYSGDRERWPRSAPSSRASGTRQVH
jgi:hypothetical protein